MSLGLKALHPYFIYSEEEMAAYFDLGYTHFERSCDDLNIELGEWQDVSKSIVEAVESDKRLQDNEAKLASLIGEGDKYWIKGCLSWQRPFLRKLGHLPEKGIRYRISGKLEHYIPKEYSNPPNYSRPSELTEKPVELRENSIPSAVLHLEWFKYILENLEIENDLDFDKAVQETVEFFVQNREMSEETVKIQKTLSRNDIKWIEDMMNTYNYMPFWLKEARDDLKTFIQEIS